MAKCLNMGKGGIKKTYLIKEGVIQSNIEEYALGTATLDDGFINIKSTQNSLTFKFSDSFIGKEIAMDIINTSVPSSTGFATILSYDTYGGNTGIYGYNTCQQIGLSLNKLIFVGYTLERGHASVIKSTNGTNFKLVNVYIID